MNDASVTSRGHLCDSTAFLYLLYECKNLSLYDKDRDFYAKDKKDKDFCKYELSDNHLVHSISSVKALEQLNGRCILS